MNTRREKNCSACCEIFLFSWADTRRGGLSCILRLAMRVFVIVPAAGMGTRMSAGGTATAAPKQFMEIGVVPVLVRSVMAFLAVPRVDAICVAVRGPERKGYRSTWWIGKLGPRVHMVEGGAHRQESVGNALAALECEDDDIVLVHDAQWLPIDNFRGLPEE